MRFLRFNQTYSVHEDNYNIGPRYRWRFHRWEPYGKFMIGNGQFNFPFSYGHGGYLLIAPGSGLDIHFHSLHGASDRVRIPALVQLPEQFAES